MADSQPDPPESKEQKPSKPSKPVKPGVTSADVRANPGFTVGELIELALCSPEVGAVNFNILRMLLREIVGKTGIDKAPVKMNDVETHQVENFRNYVQGTSVASPMPGVLRIGQHGPAPPPGMPPGPPKAPHTPRAHKSTGGPGGGAFTAIPSSPLLGDMTAAQELFEKVTRLERQLESLYQLPSNQELLEKAKSGGASMTVNDMWQIIQLNNRIAAAEAAIQKMASLIEDLAKNMGKVKGEAKGLKRETEDLATTNSDLVLQGQDLSDKCDQCRDVVNAIQREINDIKMGWKHDRDNLEKVLGIDLGTVPSFMRPKPKRERGQSPAPMDSETPSTLFERGTQTFVKKHEKSSAPTTPRPPSRPRKPVEQYIPPHEIAKMTPEDIMKNITPEEVNQMTPGIYKELTSDQKKALNEIRKSGKYPDTQKPMGVAEMSADEIADLAAQDIQDKMPFEEAIGLSPEVLAKLTNEQRQEVQKVIDRGPPKKATSRRELGRQKKMGLAQMNQEQVQAIPPDQIAKQMSPEEAKSLPPEVLEQMSPEQKAAVKKVIQRSTGSGPGPGGQKKIKKLKPPSLGIVSMTQDQLKELSPEKIAKDLTYEEAQNIPEKVIEKMTPAQRDAIRKTIQAGPPPGYKEKAAPARRTIGVASMNTDELKEISEKEIAEMPYEEAKKIPAAVLAQMSAEQKEAIEKIVALGPEEIDDDDADYEEQPKRLSGEKRRSRLSEGEIENIAEVPPENIATEITPEQAAAIPEEELHKRFTKGQVKELNKLRQEHKRKSDSLKGQDGKLDVELAAEMSPLELMSLLTEEHIEGLTDEDLEALTPAQIDVINEIRKSLVQEEEDAFTDDYSHRDEDHEEEESGTGDKRKSKRDKRPDRHKHRGEKGKHRHHKRKDDASRSRIDVLKGPLPAAGEPLPPMTLEEYLAQLPPEEAANLAADAVQKELEKQYKHLQGMQRQLAQDIQEKMEFIYQKLLKEIATQQLTTSPYMAIGGPETCLGPGICTGHGMPAGIAVCQFPEAAEKEKQKAMLPGQAGAVGEIPDGSVCPGPGVCPGSEICPYCKADSQARDALLALKGAEKKAVGDVSTSGKAPATAATPSQPARTSELEEALLQEMKSLMMLDLEKIRDDMRSKKFGAYDEQDIVERLGAVWEALKILKYNEEALAVKIARQDAFMKKIPPKTVDKLRKIPDENLDALITGNLGKLGLGMGEEHRGTLTKDPFDMPHMLRAAPSTGPGGGGADREDIQTLFNNLANVIAECAEQKDRIDQLSDTARILESGMVTKQMLIDALSDKADRGLINTKVSYDEFGNTIDELHTQLHNLMVEGYQRNENWKKVTADLAAELADKLDKVELAPIRAFFKSHLKNLEEKVRNLSQQIEEPDPAGTRKKLLKDYNCLSCDRMVNISGVTNGPTLPTVGPIVAGHTTASKRALDLHRMRMAKQFETDRRNLNSLEKQGKMNKARKQQPNSAPFSNDMDVVSVVNRYTGGSHTNVTHADIVAATHKPPQGSDPINTILPEAGAAGVARSKSQTGQMQLSKARRQSGEKLAAV